MIPLFDAHCDTIYESYVQGKNLLKENPRGHLDLKRTAVFSPYAQFFAAFFDSKGKSEAELKEIFQRQYAVFQNMLEENGDCISLCRTKEEAESAFSQGKAAAFFSVEGAELLACSIEGLEQAHALGARAVNLTWNHSNALSGSIGDCPHVGLSSLGRQFVSRMQDLGMLVDVSHLSEAGFWDVIALAKKPIMASHSNARFLWNHPRNLTDAQFLAIVANGGVAGLNMYAGFLGENPDFSTIEAHLAHFLSLGGEDHIAIGGDWDGCDRLPRGMEQGRAGLSDLYTYLLQRNYSKSLLHKLYFQNLMRVVGEVCTI